MEEKKLTKSQAIDILIQAVEIGRKRGVYTFPEAALINSALGALDERKNEKAGIEPEK